MMNELGDPWLPISPPDQTTNVSGRRVDPNLPWAVFWALDVDQNCLLMLRHQPENKPRKRLPKLKGVQVETRTPNHAEGSLLVIRLLEREQREIFHRLCLDIISAVEAAETENEAVERFVARTWRWHKLLRGGRDGRLSDEEQKGLIGELSVLRDLLIPSIGAKSAVSSWMGPTGAPKDFEIGKSCIEVKARRGASKPIVSVSSAHQLDTHGIDVLFLNVVEVTSGADTDQGAKTITQFAKQVFDQIEISNPSMIDRFEDKLASVGFDWHDDYSDMVWLEGRSILFEIKDEFPRLVSSLIPSGVDDVRYKIALADCMPFQIEVERVYEVISGETDGTGS